MKFVSALLAYILFFALDQSTAQTQSSIAENRYSYVRIYMTSARDRQRLQESGIALDHVRSKPGVFVETFLQTQEIEDVTKSGFAYDILINDWEKYYKAQKKFSREELETLKARSRVKGFKFGSMGGYLTFDEVVVELDSMRLMYPDLISEKISIGKSIENRDLWMVKISSSPDVPRIKPEVLFNSITHAREPQGMMTLIYFMYYLLENYGSDLEVSFLLDNRELYFVPVINPDGYVHNQTTTPNGGGLWRKNRRLNDNGTYGVDLNRNFGFQWGFDNQGSSGVPSSATYRGTSPFSEPETQGLRDLCIGRNFQNALNYHTYSNLLIYPFGYSDSETPDSLLFRDISRDMTRTNGYTYGTGSQTVGYTVNGDADDWMYGEQTEKSKIISMTPEVGNYDDFFWPQPERIIPLVEENLDANLYAAWVAGAYILPTNIKLHKEFPQAGDIIFVSLRLKNKGLSESGAQLMVDVISESPYVNLLQSQVALGDLPSLAETKTPLGALRFEVLPGHDQGEYVTLNINILQNGVVVTEPFTFQLGAGYDLLADDAEVEYGLWTFSGGWGRDSSLSYEGIYSFKDAPYSSSVNNANAEMTLAAPLDFTNVLSARLEFQTRYDIEASWDFGQVLVSIDSGNTWQPLQGKLMSPGNGSDDFGGKQPVFEPGYDGIVHEWAKEEISLDEFAGQPDVLFKFRFRSDNIVARRGWYVDNIRVIGYSAIPTFVENSTTPLLFSLEQNYPNPFNPATVITYSLPVQQFVSLKIYNILGELVATLVDREQPAGIHRIRFSPDNLPSGIYFYRLSGDGASMVRKMIFVK